MLELEPTPTLLEDPADDVSVEVDGACLSVDELADRFGGRIAIVIPAYEEAENLPEVLPRMPVEIAGLAVAVLVVDDGSRDDTAAVALQAGAVVARLADNRGGGAALRVGYALAVAARARIVVTMDADGQHRPEELGQLIEPIVTGQAQLVVGSRILGSAEPGLFARELGIAFFNRLVSAVVGRRVTDCSNGYRAIRAELLPMLELRQQQFHAAEFLIEAVTRGIPTMEVPITVLRRSHGTSKKPASVRYGLGFASAIFAAWRRAVTRGGTTRHSDRTPLAAEPSALEHCGG